MTYTELFNLRWNGKTEEAQFLTSLDTATRLAWVSLNTLHDFHGFVWWWCELDKERRDNIFEALRKNLEGLG